MKIIELLKILTEEHMAALRLTVARHPCAHTVDVSSEHYKQLREVHVPELIRYPHLCSVYNALNVLTAMRGQASVPCPLFLLLGDTRAHHPPSLITVPVNKDPSK